MSRYTKEDIFRIVEEEDVEFIRLQFTDIFGTLKNVAITSSQLEKALNNKCMFDGSSIEGFVRIEESDMYLYPDLDTFTIFPWRPQQGKVARIICDIYCADKTPFTGDSRYILKRQIEEAKNLGYTFNVGPECEFFLFHQDENGQPTTLSHEKAGYFDLGPVDLGENARRDMVLTLEDMGYEIEASHHEVAPTQHEIDFKYDEALQTADNIMTFKLAVKTIAKRHGLELEEEAEYGNREYLEKQDYILFKQKEQMKNQTEILDTLTLKIEEVEALIDEVSDIAYDKAVEVVTDEVRVETHKEDIRLVEQSKAWVLSPERKASQKERTYAVSRLDGVITKITKAMQTAVKTIQTTLIKPEVKKANTEQIKKKARSSILDRLTKAKITAEQENRERWEHEGRTKLGRNDMEL